MYINKQRLSLSLEELKELKDALPHGSLEEIAEKTGMSVTSVKHVLNGRWENGNVIDTACQIIAERSGVVKKRRILISDSIRQHIALTNSN